METVSNGSKRKKNRANGHTRQLLRAVMKQHPGLSDPEILSIASRQGITNYGDRQLSIHTVAYERRRMNPVQRAFPTSALGEATGSPKDELQRVIDICQRLMRQIGGMGGNSVEVHAEKTLDNYSDFIPFEVGIRDGQKNLSKAESRLTDKHDIDAVRSLASWIGPWSDSQRRLAHILWNKAFFRG